MKTRHLLFSLVCGSLVLSGFASQSEGGLFSRWRERRNQNYNQNYNYQNYNTNYSSYPADSSNAADTGNSAYRSFSYGPQSNVPNMSAYGPPYKPGVNPWDTSDYNGFYGYGFSP